MQYPPAFWTNMERVFRTWTMQLPRERGFQITSTLTGTRYNDSQIVRPEFRRNPGDRVTGDLMSDRHRGQVAIIVTGMLVAMIAAFAWVVIIPSFATFYLLAELAIPSDVILGPVLLVFMIMMVVFTVPFYASTSFYEGLQDGIGDNWFDEKVTRMCKGFDRFFMGEDLPPYLG